jgi:hypothetical protein
MVGVLRTLLERLEQLPEPMQEEAARRFEPIVDELVDRRWDDLFAETPDEVWDKMLAEVDARIVAGEVRPVPDCSGSGPITNATIV